MSNLEIKKVGETSKVINQQDQKQIPPRRKINIYDSRGNWIGSKMVRGYSNGRRNG